MFLVAWRSPSLISGAESLPRPIPSKKPLEAVAVAHIKPEPAPFARSGLAEELVSNVRAKNEAHPAGAGAELGWASSSSRPISALAPSCPK